MKGLERRGEFADQQGGWKVVGDSQRKFIKDYETGLLPHQKKQLAMGEQTPKRSAGAVTPTPIPTGAAGSGGAQSTVIKADNVQNTTHVSKVEIRHNKFSDLNKGTSAASG